MLNSHTKPIAKLLIPALIFLLLTCSVWADITTDVNVINQLNERLERNKIELLKAIKDSQNATQNSTQFFIDNNFEVLDSRIQDFLKAAKRDMAVIMVAAFLVGFAVSQIIKISIERSRRKALMQRAVELDAMVVKLEQQATELASKVRQLKALDSTYTNQLKALTKKRPFITIQAALLAVIAFILGVALMLVVKGG